MNKKLWMVISVILMVCILTLVGWRLFMVDSDKLDEVISSETYKSYDAYGFAYDGDESEIYGMLGELLPETHFVGVLTTDQHKIYTSTEEKDFEAVGYLLSRDLKIREIAYSESMDSDGTTYHSYWVDYLDLDGNRVIITYFAEGMVTKTIAYIDENKAVTVNNNLTRDVYYMKLEKDNPIFSTETWQSVVGREFVNYDVWAGSGLYFQQVGNEAYCTLMIYGSGVRVALHYTAPVTVSEDGSIEIYLPKSMSTGYLLEARPGEQKMTKVSLSLENEQVVLGDLRFIYDPGAHNYQYIKELE